MLNFDSVTLLEKVEVIEAAWLEVSKADSLKSKMHPPKLFSSLQVFIYLFIYFYVFYGYLQVVISGTCLSLDNPRSLLQIQLYNRWEK